jgi:hypothetical protein
VPAVQGAGRNRVEELEGAHHGAGGQQVQPQAPARHGVDAGDVVLREFMEDIALRPGGLEAQHGGLRAAHIGLGQHGGPDGTDGRGLEQAPAARSGRFVDHAFLPGAARHRTGCTTGRRGLPPVRDITGRRRTGNGFERPARRSPCKRERGRRYFVTKAFSTT